MEITPTEAAGQVPEVKYHFLYGVNKQITVMWMYLFYKS